ncbi:MAG TPA: DUF2254 domain-containing protein [Pyrinomonadaceae bacterium]|nr:DUF2254 domain-containing protein [Pyrinomonadaceae bacterium]
MTWLLKYRVRLYVRNSLWILPALSIVVALLAARWVIAAELALGWHATVSPDTARLIMTTVAASTFTLVVLVSSAMLLAVQLASAQLTPRIIALIYRSPYGKLAFGVFVFTFTFSVATLVRIEDRVPLVASYVAAYGFLLSLALFILFTDTMGKMLRPSSALRRVGLRGREVIKSVFPSLRSADSKLPEPFKLPRNIQTRVILNDEDGAVLAFDLPGVVSKATKADCVVELVPQVGDFIAAGDPIFRVFGDAPTLSDGALRNSVAIGHERTLEQDPMFAFRIIVDIASKALSPAINDPTTAVLAIDQIHHLLREVGKRLLTDGHEPDAQGRVRLIYRTPEWEDFVQLGTTEIRQYGRDSIQVQRRLRAMLQDLIETLPPHRHQVLQKELALLGSSSKRAFPDLDDQALAESGDLQGIGGSDDELYEETATALSAPG